jgi:hypothetical protein
MSHDVLMKIVIGAQMFLQPKPYTSQHPIPEFTDQNEQTRQNIDFEMVSFENG